MEEPNKKYYVRAIVLAPTKELATQIHKVFQELLAHHPASAELLKPPTEDEDMDGLRVPRTAVSGEPAVRSQLLIGGRTKIREDLDLFRDQPANVLVATPKRLLEFLTSSNKAVIKEHSFDLLVLDEADRLLDSNFGPDVQRLLEMLPKQRRTSLFSASVSEAVDQLMRVGMRYPFRISAKVRSKSGNLDKKTPESLKLCYIVCKASHKLPTLRKLIRNADQPPEKLIVYVSTRAGVDYWQNVLPVVLGSSKAPVPVFPLHGDHKDAIRSKNLTKFRDSQGTAILLTTDVLARGIDIPDIDLVVQLDPPNQPKDFIHRCGRAGRAGRRGVAVTFLNEGSEEDYIKYLNLQGTRLEHYESPPQVTHEEANTTMDRIRKVVMTDRKLHDRAQRAFPSWVQAYTKTLPLDIFDVRKVDWLDTGRAWGLLRWPNMPELKRFGPSEIYDDRTFGLGVSTHFSLPDLKYKDKTREARRVALLEARDRGELPKTLNVGKAGKARIRKEKAWSSQKDAKSLRENRRERKESRRKAETTAKMSAEERVEAMKLEGLIARVREQNAADEDFEGFD